MILLIGAFVAQEIVTSEPRRHDHSQAQLSVQR